MNNELRSAFHEAGHAVLAVLCGAAFSYVSLKRVRRVTGGQTDIWVEGVIYPPAEEATLKAALLEGKRSDSELSIQLAGMLAEGIHVGAVDDACRFGATGDLASICIALGVRFGCTPAEVPSRPEWHALMAPAIEACTALLLTHWRAVDRIATLLIQRRKLGWNAVCRMAAEVGVPDERV